MKKLLALLLAVVCLFSLSACFGNEAANENADSGTVAENASGEKSDEAEAKEALIKVLDAVKDLNPAAAKGYVSDEAEFAEIMEDFNVDEIVNEMPDELGEYKDDFRSIMEDLLDKVKGSITYEIKDCREEDGAYIFNVELGSPDVENLDIDSLLEENLSQETLMELVSEIDMTAATSEEEMMKILMPKLLEAIKVSFEEMEFTTEITEEEATVKKIDGKWMLIN